MVAASPVSGRGYIREPREEAILFRYRQLVSRVPMERDALVVFVGTTVMNLAAYGFHVLVSRGLRPAGYSEVVAVLAVALVAAVPSAAIQYTISRRVALADGQTATSIVGSVVPSAVLLGLLLTAIGGALSSVLAPVLNVSQSSIWWLSVWVGSMPVMPVLLGHLQGCRRFGWLAAAFALLGVGRVVAAAVALSVGLGTSGVVAGLAAAGWLVPLVLLVVIGVEPWRRRSLPFGLGREVFGSIAPFMGMALISGVDVLVARRVLTGREAGSFVAASVTGKIVLWVPAAVAYAAHPRFAVEEGHGRGSLTRALRLVWTLCAGSWIGLAVFGGLITRVMFGSQYDPSSAVILTIASAMVAVASMQVMLVWSLAQQDRSVSVVITVGSVAVALAVVLADSSPGSIARVLLAGVVILAVATSATVLRLRGSASLVG